MKLMLTIKHILIKLRCHGQDSFQVFLKSVER